MRAACAIRGRATGTRELDALNPRHLVDRIDAILLTGGSAYGLGAADGVMRWLKERGRGLPVGSAGIVPIVPTAVTPFSFLLTQRAMPKSISMMRLRLLSNIRFAGFKSR